MFGGAILAALVVKTPVYFPERMMNWLLLLSVGIMNLSIATARGGRVIELADAKEFADEVEDLAATMWLGESPGFGRRTRG